MKKNIKNDYCIRMFTVFDDLRPQFKQVHLENETLYATNTHMLAKVKAENCIKKYTAIEKFPNAENLFSQHISFDKIKLTVNDLFNELMKIEVCFKPQMVGCGECSGDGTKVCEYCESEHECKECKGTGEIKSTNLILSGEHNCILFNKKYKLHYLDIILKTAVILNIEEIEISNSKEEFGGSIFTVGDFTILLMTVN